MRELQYCLVERIVRGPDRTQAMREERSRMIELLKVKSEMWPRHPQWEKVNHSNDLGHKINKFLIQGEREN